MLADRRRSLVHDLVLRRAAALEREVEAGELELEADHVRGEDAEAPPRAAPARSRPLRGRRSWCRLASGGQCRPAWGGLGEGARAAFRYYDARGRQVADPAQVERIERLAIPPAWQDVWISPSPRAKLQATGRDKAGRKQYLYHPDYRAAQEQAKYDNLIRFAEKLPDLRATMAEHLDKDGLDRERVSAIALRLINLGWFRVGSERYVRESRTYGITTLTQRHVTVRGHRICARVSAASTGSRCGRRSSTRSSPRRCRSCSPRRARASSSTSGRAAIYNLTSKRLNDYVKLYLGPEFTAKDFRTWGGTLLAAIALAERARRDGFPETKTRRRSARSAPRCAAWRAELGNTPAVCRASYVSPAVVDQYLEGRTIEDFRPRHLRVVGARDVGLDAEEQALLSLLRSWRIRQARAAA